MKKVADPEAPNPISPARSRRSRIYLFVVTVIVLTAVVIVAVFAFSKSWVTGGTAGGIAGVVSVIFYPFIVRPRR